MSRHGVLWCFMVFYGVYCVLWCFMVFYGVLWCFMMFYGVLWCFGMHCQYHDTWRHLLPKTAVTAVASKFHILSDPSPRPRTFVLRISVCLCALLCVSVCLVSLCVSARLVCLCTPCVSARGGGGGGGGRGGGGGEGGEEAAMVLNFTF